MRVLQLLTAVLSLVAIRLACGDEMAMVERTINSWQAESGIYLTRSVQRSFLAEASEARSSVLSSPTMELAYDDEDLANAVRLYLDSQVIDTESPTLESLLREEISPGGQVFYTKKYPRLSITAEFEMDGLTVNDEDVTIDPAKETVTVLLNIGDNDVATHGGDEDDCTFAIAAERGQRYRRSCPAD